jgi:energy-coupling factor transporter ATP-binding protein EcfA2
MFSFKNIFHITPARESIQNKDIHKVFKLPINYLDEAHVFELSKSVTDDLELSTPQLEDTSGNIQKGLTMYEHILKPTNEFSKSLIPEWSKHFTNDILFLTESQEVIRNVDYVLQDEQSVDCTKMISLWEDTKQDENFVDKYSFIEWEIGKHLNSSSGFLQTLSFINMASPVLSFFIPIFFLIFPFLILKIQGIPIDVTTYVNTLKNIAKNHFIGMIIKNAQTMSFTNMAYIAMLGGLYFLQIYQNYRSCVRFYANLNKINDHITNLKNYLDTTIKHMTSFTEINAELSTYSNFCSESTKHIGVLQQLRQELESIHNFKPTFSKLTEIGYLLKCFYKIHDDDDYENAIRYSIGFEGYISCIKGIRENTLENNVTMSSFTTDSDTKINNMCYPALINENPVRNNCDLKKNAIITGPNASGKTTMLKSMALNVIFSQQFGCGFYESSCISPYTHIHSYLNIPDTSQRDSLFQAESRRCKEILDIIDTNGTDTRHLCIFDELYSGTNPDEAVKSAHAFLLYLSKKQNVDFMLTTHYVSLCKKIKKTPNFKTYKMDVTINNDRIDKYTFKMVNGISKVKGGVAILEELNYPKEILNNIHNAK